MPLSVAAVFPPRTAFFFFNDTATTEIYTLSLHDALPICCGRQAHRGPHRGRHLHRVRHSGFSRASRSVDEGPDRKSTRLNSSHSQISYAVFCLKKKKKTITPLNTLPLEPRTSASRGVLPN